MKRIQVYHYDAFSRLPNKGNPAGVVISDECLTDDQMQEIAKKVGFNETAFVIQSDKADLGIRYFTPGHEMNLCGHGTVATVFCLHAKGILGSVESLTIDTKAGIIPIRIDQQQQEVRIRMGQKAPEFIEFHGDLEMLAHSIGLVVEDLDSSLKVVYGSTGIWTLLVPIVHLKAFSRMKPQNDLFPSLLLGMERCSIHPFCLKTTKPYAHMHSRHFSSPYSGTIEDPVTGTASGVMGAYYATYIDQDSRDLQLIMEQGQEMNRDGEVFVHLQKQGTEIQVDISGTAVYIKDMFVTLDDCGDD